MNWGENTYEYLSHLPSITACEKARLVLGQPGFRKCYEELLRMDCFPHCHQPVFVEVSRDYSERHLFQRTVWNMEIMR